MNRPAGLIQHQRGAIAIIIGISIAVLVGMIGLALDLGRMFVIKTELQNAADACALAAARELDGNTDAITRADAVGILIGTRNRINFQDENAPVTTASLTYSAALSPNSGYSRSIAPASAEYVMCTVERPNVGMLFMGVRGFGAQTVNAYAVATLAPGQTTCAIPLGICKPVTPDDPDDPFGLQAGKWYWGKFESGTPGLTGSYNWIIFDTNNAASELKDLLSGPGMCELPAAGTCVGKQGQVSAASDPWNTRFGMYKGSYTVDEHSPDFAGLAYTKNGIGGANQTTWTNPTPENAYKGTPQAGSTVQNYWDHARTSHDPYQKATNPSNINGINAYDVKPSAVLAEKGIQRREVLAPIVDCAQLLGSGELGCPTQKVKIKGYACVLMLNPIKGPDDVVVEYIGPPDAPGSPCGSFGLGGGSGPLVPVLVQ